MGNEIDFGATEFEKIDYEATQKYIVRTDKYGESWKTMKLWELQKRLREECAELLDAPNTEEIHEESLDVINIARMIGERTRT